MKEEKKGVGEGRKTLLMCKIAPFWVQDMQSR
jgi:hypothetical protein